MQKRKTCYHDLGKKIDPAKIDPTKKMSKKNSAITALIKEFQLELEALGNIKTKKWWENYVKHNTKFRGVSIPKIREKLKEFYKKKQIYELPLDEQLHLALSFFCEKYSEDKITAILLLQLYLYNKFDWKLLLSSFEELFKNNYIHDWNICDWFCIKVLGALVSENKSSCAKAISQWSTAENVWQARCSVVAFADLAKEKRYTPLLLKSSRILIKRDERFAKTAVGWILRELSKADKNYVVDFIKKNRSFFSKESLENAIKYFSQEQKKKIREF